MNKRKKYLILAIIVACAFAIVGPLIINECYKSNSGYITLWSPADMLAYYGVVLGALVAIITVVVTIGFTRKQIQMENFLKQENEKWTKIEAIFANAIDKINPMHPLIETMDTGMKDPVAAITTFQKYGMMCKIALDQLNAHLCVNDYPKVKKLIDSICNATEIFDKISDGEIQAYSSLRDYSSLAVVKETLKIEKEHPGTFPVETIPPFNLKNWRKEDELTDDPRFTGFSVMPPVANANYAWILHMLSKLDVSHGIAGFLLANGALNADSDEYTLRKEILEKDRVEAIIVLPRDMFYTTDISVTLWIINMNKKAGTVNGRQLRDRTHEILFMDLRRWNENIEEIVIDKGKKKKKTVLTDTQIAQIKEVYNNWQSADTTLYSDVPEFCRSVKLFNADLTNEEQELMSKGKLTTIEAKNYSLSPSKYIEFIDHDLDIDYASEMTRIQAEMQAVLIDEKHSQAMLEEAFRGIGYGIN